MHTCSFRLSDALVTANEHLKFPGKDGDTTMSEVICDKDMDAYINLTDSVVDRILQTPSDELKEVMMRVQNVVCFSAKYFCMPSLCAFTLH